MLLFKKRRNFTQWFFWSQMFSISWKIFGKRIFYHKFLVFWGFKKKKITKIFHNCLQHERMFLYSYFEYWQMGKPILGGTTKNHLPKTLDLIQLIFKKLFSPLWLTCITWALCSMLMYTYEKKCKHLQKLHK
jgi:hypothetical protein